MLSVVLALEESQICVLDQVVVEVVREDNNLYLGLCGLH